MAAVTTSAPVLVDFMILVFTVSPIPGASGRCFSTPVVPLSYRSAGSALCPTAPPTRWWPASTDDGPTLWRVRRILQRSCQHGHGASELDVAASVDHGSQLPVRGLEGDRHRPEGPGLIV